MSAAHAAKSGVVYVHGNGGTSAEADHYAPLLPEYGVIGFDYRASFPWGAREEFSAYFRVQREKYDSLVVIANSIGAYFTMCSGVSDLIDRAFFISPVVNMENLICRMIAQSGVSEDELRRKGIIRTSFGDELSWQYLSYTRTHPVVWNKRTDILCAENDAVTPLDEMRAFAKDRKADLCVMPGGEHWFHTSEQMHFLDRWLKERIRAN